MSLKFPLKTARSSSTACTNGSAYAICGKMVDDEMRYGIFAVNGEKVVDYNFVEYEIPQGKVVMIKEDGKKWFYSKLGTRLRA